MKTRSTQVDSFAFENLPKASTWPDFILDHPSATYPEYLNASTELLEKTIALVGGNKIALIAADATLTYQQLLHLVNQIANYFQEQGVVSGNRIAIRSPNNALSGSTVFI